MTSDVQNSGQIPLEYAPLRSILKSRVGLSVIVVLALVGGVFAYNFLQQIRPRLSVLALQRKCTSMSFPPEKVAYEEDAASAALLSGNKPSGPDWTTLSDPSGNTMAWYLAPGDVKRFIDWKSPSVFTFDPFSYFLFMHGRRAQGAPARIVHVGVANVGTFTLRPVITAHGTWPRIVNDEFKVLQWEVIEPATLFKGAERKASGTWGDGTLHTTMPFPLRLYAGQADPADESHFTIKGMTPKGTFVIDGKLQPDDQITFSIR